MNMFNIDGKDRDIYLKYILTSNMKVD